MSSEAVDLPTSRLGHQSVEAVEMLFEISPNELVPTEQPEKQGSQTAGIPRKTGKIIAKLRQVDIQHGQSGPSRRANKQHRYCIERMPGGHPILPGREGVQLALRIHSRLSNDRRNSRASLTFGTASVSDDGRSGLFSANTRMFSPAEDRSNPSFSRSSAALFRL